MIDGLLAWFIAVLTVSGMWVWFWAAVCFCGILTFAEREENVFALIVAGLYAVVINLSTEFKFVDNLWTVAFWLVAFYAVGAFWSVGKWFSFVNQKADHFGDLKVEWIRKHRNTDYEPKASAILTADDQQHFFQYIREHRVYSVRADLHADYDTIEYFQPVATRYKERLLTWILWWPASACWTFLNDPLVRLAKWVISRFNGVYCRIVTRAYSKFG